MLTMEAELRALREELTSRPAAKAAKNRTPTDETSKARMSVDESSSAEPTSKPPNGVKPKLSTEENSPPTKRVRLSQNDSEESVESPDVDNDGKIDVDRNEDENEKKNSDVPTKDKLSK
jgi:hypothetical protein